MYKLKLNRKAESTVATPAPTISSGAAVASTLQGTRYEDTSSSHDDSSNHSGDKNDSLAQCARELGACNPTEQTKSESPPDPKSDKVTPSKYSHVTIVRDFEVDEEKRVEMRDASTQFTGNHASIQTDLVPDGMRNLLTATSTANRKSEVCPSNPEDVRVQRVPQPPPPPISSMFGSPMYSLDILKLPGTSSTSIYKQQLLALQEQILQKKRETERIVHDRMTFQYSSSRGTERFLAARRTQKLELWEALMRVDPTLDERKAREVARLSQAAST
ncbi:hypothetical protein ON010_g18235 [Phytophthora cinnamomi]|nr:hypothetical protein ON010_g18235 [Phytophthora cinnamomi]